MPSVSHYRNILVTLDDWEPYLLAESGLPGPRANLELAQAVADLGELALFEGFLTNTVDVAPVNSQREFLALCGVIGLGRLIAEGDTQPLAQLRVAATDSRWRTREGVCLALQRVGDRDMDFLIEEMARWSEGALLEQRAAACALCEPHLLAQADHARRVLAILDAITLSICDVTDRRSDAFRALRKGLGYCWSVAVVALPDVGKPLLEKWLASADKDVQWIMKQNLQKARLRRLDATWVKRCLSIS